MVMPLRVPGGLFPHPSRHAVHFASVAASEPGAPLMLKPCLVCGLPSKQPRCPAHTAPQRTHAKSTAERGYGTQHRRERQQLARTLPAPCGYCGETIYATDTWQAAHRVDGHSEYGYVVSHPACNQAAKAKRR